MSRLQPACLCLSGRCVLEGECCHWGISIPPSGLHRWLGGPCRESGDEEKIWGRWRTCRETAARKPWRGGSILNRLSTDLTHGSIPCGEWTDRCRCRSAGWVVLVLAAACSSTSQKKGPREHGCPVVEPIPTSPPQRWADDEVRAGAVCLPPSSHNGTPLSNDSVELRDETQSEEESGGCPEGTQSESWEHKMRRSLSLSARVERGTRSRAKKKKGENMFVVPCLFLVANPDFPWGRVGGRHGPLSNTGAGF